MKGSGSARKWSAVGMSAVLIAALAAAPVSAAQQGGNISVETAQEAGGPGAQSAGPGAQETQPAGPGAQEAGGPGTQPVGPGVQETQPADPGTQETAAGSASQATQPAAGAAQAQTEESSGISEEEIDAYFDGSVMVGDSIMLGFRNYAMRRQNTWLSRLQFLAAGSYSTSHALEPVTQKSLHPIYAGQKRPIWESISLMGAKKVFILFGMNDLNISGIEGTCENYKAIAANIRALDPEAEIHLISMTYVLRGKAKRKLNNDNIRAFNEALARLAAENGWGYVDLAPHLADEGGDLAAVYCSDEFVHQTPEAYDVWCAVLREYAKSRLTAARQPAAAAGPGSTTAGPGATGSGEGPGAASMSQ